jgi:hypothetical protein
VIALDPGHRYALDTLDAQIPTVEILRFVKRTGLKYPGNHDPACSGTTTQEVIRALIDRQRYVDNQRPDVANEHVVTSLRNALRLLEVRAAHERDDTGAALVINNMNTPETEPVCAGCGHLLCRRSHP